jgi:beta-glucosidase
LLLSRLIFCLRRFLLFTKKIDKLHRLVRGRTITSICVALLLLGTLAFLAAPQVEEQWNAYKNPIYRDVNRSFDDRADDLISRMSIGEKISQLMNDTPAIDRLNMPAYEWWNEGLHGVARAGPATVFPQAIGLAASFDRDLIRDVAVAIGDEARAKHHQFVQRDSRLRYQGLTFWSPTINIFRDPRWGRGQETYGEDPYLTALLGVEYVKALQASDGKYRKLDATAKHFAVHSGPEHNRRTFNAEVSERDLYETYLPAFRALVQEGQVKAVMGAFNRVNGESASASPRLLQDILRNEWGFKGYVVSDYEAVKAVYTFHKLVATEVDAAVLALKSGTNLNCGTSFSLLKDAVKKDLVTETDIDASLKPLILSRFELGMFDSAQDVSWAKIASSVIQSPAHNQLATQAAQESLVLLKNEGILPLSKKIKNIAVIGPTADEVMSLLGNYYGTPKAPVTILKGIQLAAPKTTQVSYARGANLVEGREDPRAAPVVDSIYLRPNAQAAVNGLTGEYFRGTELKGVPMLTRIDPQINFRWDRVAPTEELLEKGEIDKDAALPNDYFSARWTGQLLPPVSGRYEVGVSGNDGFRLYVDGKLVIDSWELRERLEYKSVFLDFEMGHPYDIKLEYFEDYRDAEVRMSWRFPDTKSLLDEAMENASAADVIIFVGGLTGDIEGEEMKINYPGFESGDRIDIGLPSTQQALLEKLATLGKPIVLVLTTGSALAVDWAKENLPAILVAWYPGQEGGTAVAKALFGVANPAGRSPVTFYKQTEKLPAFDNYSMQGRTYRYFEGEPLYPFGHGLSYSHFVYSDLILEQRKVSASSSVKIRATVKNTSSIAGDEVVQLYIKPVAPLRERALKELKGLMRIHLQPGEAREVVFLIQPSKDFVHYDQVQKKYALDLGDYEVQLGASSADIRLRSTLTVQNN